MNKNNFYVILLLLIFSSCQKDDNDEFDSKMYIEGNSKIEELLIKAEVNEDERIIQVAIAKPENSEVFGSYEINKSYVDTYNELYNATAEMLPEGTYSLEKYTSVIKIGEVKSKENKVFFKNLSSLDRELVYVLPVTISNSNMPFLRSDQTKYYVFKGAALINTVGDIEENYLSVNWTNPSVCNNLSQLTIETLIRARDFDRLISSVMGIEGSLLIRIGDAGYPSNQIQIATRLGNFPGADPKLGLPLNEWIHVALTYDAGDSGKMQLYVNGELQATANRSLGNVNLGVSGFYIGRSYDDSRYLAGDISECRIWNKVRTKEEITSNPYYVDPSSEGLVAYWKINDNSNGVILDHTGNNNNAISNKPMKWTSVNLPKSKN